MTGRLGERPREGVTAPAAGSLRGWGAGARIAGAVFTLGYVLGIVRGPLLAVAGGFALVTLGRAAAAAPPDDLVLGGALAVFVGALQVGGLRWETIELAELRGAQAVLGPSLLVGPQAAAAACWTAALAATGALAAWLATVRGFDGAMLPRGLWIGEAVLASLAIVTVFWGLALPRGSIGGRDALLALLEGVAAVAVVAGAGMAGAVYLAGSPEWRRWVLVAAGTGVAGAAVAVVAAVS